MIAFLLTAFFIGFVIVYIVPKVKGWVAQAPYGSRISGNKFAQLLIVGVVVTPGVGAQPKGRSTPSMSAEMVEEIQAWSCGVLLRSGGRSFREVKRWWLGRGSLCGDFFGRRWGGARRF